MGPAGVLLIKLAERRTFQSRPRLGAFPRAHLCFTRHPPQNLQVYYQDLNIVSVGKCRHRNFSHRLLKVLVASANSFEEFLEEQLRDNGFRHVLRTEGATGLTVPARKTLTQAFVVATGCSLCWEFTVKVCRD